MNGPLGRVFLAHLRGDGEAQVECLRAGRKGVGGSLCFACFVGNGCFHFEGVALPRLEVFSRFAFQLDVDGKSALRVKAYRVGL